LAPIAGTPSKSGDKRGFRLATPEAMTMPSASEITTPAEESTAERVAAPFPVHSIVNPDMPVPVVRSSIPGDPKPDTSKLLPP